MPQSVLVRKPGITVCMIALIGLWASMAFAEAGRGHGPCADDVAKFCKDVQPGGGRIIECMKEHEKDLSPACKEKIAEGKKEFHGACKDDVQKFCKDIKPGGGRIINCLKEHENELSSDCKAKLEKGRAQNK